MADPEQTERTAESVETATTSGVSEAAMLGRDYWLVRWIPEPATTADDIQTHLEAHLAWLLGLERDGVLLASGPLVEGEGVRPGAGVTVLRAENATTATALAGQDPLVVAGLRAPSVFRWRLNEGSIGVTVHLGAGTFSWR